ncbi:MAG: hypothetical protein KDA81_06475 [Planctomycetaceae bacterium]|nr:hypothetical protein [Planctomycetaceae bacterium]
MSNLRSRAKPLGPSAPPQSKFIGLKPSGIVVDGLGKAVLVASCCLAAWGLTTVNPWLTFCEFLLPPIILALLWRPNDVPIFAFAIIFQWLQGFAPVLSSNIIEIPLSQLAEGDSLPTAAWLSMLGTLATALGYYFVVRKVRTGNCRQALNNLTALSRKKLFVAYLAAQAIVSVLSALAPHMGGLRQLVLAVTAVRWVPLFLICATTTLGRKPSGWMWATIGIEVAIGMMGYFSQFKEPLFLLLIVSTASLRSERKVPYLRIAAVISLTVLLTAFWQSVKLNYRIHLSRNSGLQDVSIGHMERVSFLASAANSLTLEDLKTGLASGINRVGYIQFFAHTLDYVPSQRPHENGALWAGAVLHLFQPRILFPDKPEIDASARTIKYTGIPVAGRERGTSITIGLMGESYIDFGAPGMFLPLFLLGVFYGKIAKYFYTASSNLVLGQAYLAAIFLTYALYIGMSNISLVGGCVTTSVTLVVVDKKMGLRFLRFVQREPMQGPKVRNRSLRTRMYIPAA